MNIDDVKEIPEVINIDTVFAEQKRLSEKYAIIERRPHNINLDTKEGQQLIKDFLWRITEEIGEAMDSPLGISHMKEELADALHFLIELCIISGLEERSKDIFELETFDVSSNPRTGLNTSYIYIKLHNLIVDLARVGRTCKNKPWKQTQIPLDQREFSNAVARTIISYMSFCAEFFNSTAEMYQFYFKKAQVNTFRQRSGY